MSSSIEEDSPPAFRWHYTEFDDGEFQIRGRTLFFAVAFFSVVLLVALLFLYARWVCRFGPPSPPPPPSSAAARAAAMAARGLDLATINSLPIVLHGGGDGTAAAAAEVAGGGGACVSGDGECCICLGVFGDGEKVKVLPKCEHRFHSDCVDLWLAAQSSCPLCRAELRVDSIV